jgi:hypothetical protein
MDERRECQHHQQHRADHEAHAASPQRGAHQQPVGVRMRCRSQYSSLGHLELEVSLAVNRSSKSKTSVSTTCAVRTRIVAAQVWIISDRQELTPVNGRRGQCALRSMMLLSASPFDLA